MTSDMAVYKILCIEDEADLREDIAEELGDAGYRVLQAADGQEGLQMMLDHRPDLVLSDITMPRMDGHTLLTTVRRDHPKLGAVPFIFVSALSDHQDLIDGLKIGADDYLTKPVDYDLLLAKVDTALQRVERIKREQSGEHLFVSTNPIVDDDIGWR
ncbi:MAG: hypothetical protein Kow0032_02860 [Methyloligellaceae bacterium]